MMLVWLRAPAAEGSTVSCRAVMFVTRLPRMHLRVSLAAGENPGRMPDELLL
jgi:hypothetical protein